jgi:hypothetical protein
MYISVCLYVCMHIYIYMYVCVCVCVCVCIYAFTYIHLIYILYDIFNRPKPLALSTPYVHRLFTYVHKYIHI